MTARDNYAVNYINTHKVGKVLVIGGLRHSGRHSRKEAKNPRSEDDKFFVAALDADYTGLDAKLGFPSVDFAVDYSEKKFGLTTPTDGKFSNFVVYLPQALRRTDKYEDFSVNWPKPLPENLGNLPSPLLPSGSPTPSVRKR